MSLWSCYVTLSDTMTICLLSLCVTKPDLYNYQFLALAYVRKQVILLQLTHMAKRRSFYRVIDRRASQTICTMSSVSSYCSSFISFRFAQVEPIWATAMKHGVKFATYLWGRCDIKYSDVTAIGWVLILVMTFSYAHSEGFYLSFAPLRMAFFHSPKISKDASWNVKLLQEIFL